MDGEKTTDCLRQTDRQTGRLGIRNYKYQNVYLIVGLERDTVPEPGPSEDAQLFVYPGTDVHIEAGKTIVLNCLAFDPNIPVHWEVPASAQSGHVDPAAAAGRLIIEGALDSDSGRYTCTSVPSDGGFFYRQGKFFSENYLLSEKLTSFACPTKTRRDQSL